LIPPKYIAFGLLIVLGCETDRVWSLENRQTLDLCATQLPEKHLGEKFASAGMLANLRGSSDSIRAIARELLDAALRGEPQARCPKNCGVRDAEVIYRVAPTVFLKSSRQRSECLSLEQQTSASPFQFAAQRFANLDDLNKWLMDFSRGKGTQGKELYRRCSSNCSPRYTFRIGGSRETGFTVVSEVLCGLARDKSEPRYSLSTAMQLHCQSNVEY
jgi:hypothetical protein